MVQLADERAQSRIVLRDLRHQARRVPIARPLVGEGHHELRERSVDGHLPAIVPT
jgi:hypothetical protein